MLSRLLNLLIRRLIKQPEEARELELSEEGVALIKQFEGYRTNAYKCSAGTWTIGYGTTIYPSGQKVKKGDKTTKELAEQYIKHDVKTFADRVKEYIKS